MFLYVMFSVITAPFVSGAYEFPLISCLGKLACFYYGIYFIFFCLCRGIKFFVVNIFIAFHFIYFVSRHVL